MPSQTRQYSALDPIDGSIDSISPIGQRKYNMLQNVHGRGGHLRRRNALVTVGPTATPGTEGNVRLITEFQHGDSPPVQTRLPDADSANTNNWTPLAGTRWAAVDDAAGAPDDDTTYVYMNGLAAGLQYFGFQDVTGFTSVSKITFYFRAKLVDLGGGTDNFAPVFYVSNDGGVTPTYLFSLSSYRFADGYVTKSSEITTDPITSSDWTQALVNTYEFGWTGTVREKAQARATQFYFVVEGTAAATRERSKIIISNTEFLRLEEDLSDFTDIDDGLASTAAVDETWDTCEFDNLIWFTNNTDALFNYPDGGNLIDQNATAIFAKTIAPFGDRLFAFNINEGAARYRSRVRWSVVGDGDDFAGAGSGNFDTDARPGQGVKLLGMAEKANTYLGVLVAYKDTSIYHIYATGDSADPFDYRLMDGSVGAVGTAAVTNYVNDRASEVHCFVGRRNGELNVFEWDGNQCVPIGDPIKDDMNDNYNPASVSNTVVDFDPNTSLVWCGVPKGAETFPTEFYVYDIVRKTWKSHVFDDNVSALGHLTIGSAPTLVGGKTDGLILKSDPSTTVDSGTDSPTIIEWAPQFFGEGVLRTKLYRVAIWYIERGATSVTVSVSTDGGFSYPESDIVSLTGTNPGVLNVAFADVMAEGYHFALKIEDETDADIEIVKVIPEWAPSGTK